MIYINILLIVVCETILSQTAPCLSDIHSVTKESGDPVKTQQPPYLKVAVAQVLKLYCSQTLL